MIIKWIKQISNKPNTPLQNRNTAIKMNILLISKYSIFISKHNFSDENHQRSF
jgi:hypothetical protein